MLTIAIPVDATNRVYHDNPCSAPLFAVYEIEGNRKDMRYRHAFTRLNPWKKVEGEMVTDPKVRDCSCDETTVKDPHHISDHYALLEVLGKCNYLLADRYCFNTVNTMRNVGIRLHKMPPFVTRIEQAIHHFIIGANYADHLQHIHPAS